VVPVALAISDPRPLRTWLHPAPVAEPVRGRAEWRGGNPVFPAHRDAGPHLPVAGRGPPPQPPHRGGDYGGRGGRVPPGRDQPAIGRGPRPGSTGEPRRGPPARIIERPPDSERALGPRRRPRHSLRQRRPPPGPGRLRHFRGPSPGRQVRRGAGGASQPESLPFLRWLQQLAHLLRRLHGQLPGLVCTPVRVRERRGGYEHRVVRRLARGHVVPRSGRSCQPAGLAAVQLRQGDLPPTGHQHLQPRARPELLRMRRLAPERARPHPAHPPRAGHPRSGPPLHLDLGSHRTISSGFRACPRWSLPFARWVRRSW
jgi:hypothetical protein